MKTVLARTVGTIDRHPITAADVQRIAAAGFCANPSTAIYDLRAAVSQLEILQARVAELEAAAPRSFRDGLLDALCGGPRGARP